ncbi:uncharacterized protein FPRN_11972 [Fusarium proliferatum]|nr:uncharacterized protein FPRN_11972 [Fusarium proliferatum]
MQARHDYITAILNARTGEAVEIAFRESLEMLRLCRGDNLSVRSQVPGLYLRLGRDQEAYDFIKWYAMKGGSNYDWRDMSLPFLDLQGEDAFEAVIGKPLSYDEEAMSDVLQQRADIVAKDDYKDLIAELKRQVLQLYKMVKEDNKHIWPGIENPNLYAYDVPAAYSPGSREEAVLIFRQSWYSWSETEPAIRHIRGVINDGK